MNRTSSKDRPITGKIPASEASNYYVWKTLGDNRVRSRHAHRDGRIFHRDRPPEGGHPGEDYGCRCQALPVPTSALLPEEFQSDSKSLQYEDLFESGKVDKFNKMVEADNKREEVDKKLADEGSRLIKGEKKSPDKFNKTLRERKKIQKDVVKSEGQFFKAAQSNKPLAKKTEPNKQDIDREFDGLLAQHGFGAAYAMIENRYGRGPAFDMLKRKYGPAEAGKLFKKQLEAKMIELNKSLAEKNKWLKDKNPDRDADSYAPLKDPSKEKEGVYYVSRPIDEPIIGKFQSHNFIVYNADSPGDPDGQIISFGEKNNDNLGRVGKKTTSSSKDTHEKDVQFWHSRRVKENATRISDDDLAAINFANALNPNLDYKLAGPNSNSVAQAIAQRVFNQSGKQGPVAPPNRNRGSIGVEDSHLIIFKESKVRFQRLSEESKLPPRLRSSKKGKR